MSSRAEPRISPYEFGIVVHEMRSEAVQREIIWILLSLIFKLRLWVCVHVCGFLWRPEESIGSPGTGGRGDCELPDVGILSYQAISRP